ncbi:hypothetical protein [Haematobacter missouriensis]|jgi:hypothetical protein|uniref:hypothetical protein n=1 Tax=Haematobacter missouriensis TaxID=366616 RepID=UPI00117B6038|nr:hypothetical protein [Haematobacter missouriensis]
MSRLPLIMVVIWFSAEAALAEQLPIYFNHVEINETADPTELWTPSEILEGGSVVQPSIWHSTFPVDGGEVTMSVLVDHWCSMTECPYRIRLTAPALGVELRGEGMACQARDIFTYDPIDLTVTACAQTIDLKELR